MPTSTPPGGAGSRFFSLLGDRILALEGRPRSWNLHAIVDLRPVAAEELEVPREGNVGVTWRDPLKLDQARKVVGGGLYIIEKSSDGGTTWIPDYVGQTKDYNRRLAIHGRTRARDVPGSTYRVRLGHVAHADVGSHVAALPEAKRAEALRRLRLTTEHGIIRSLLRSGFHLLQNRSSIRQLMPVGRGLTIQHIGGPKYLQVTSATTGVPYELEGSGVVP